MNFSNLIENLHLNLNIEYLRAKIEAKSHIKLLRK